MTDKYIWGYHASFDVAGCDKELITDKENLLAFADALVDAIGMKAYGPPEAVHFAAHDPGKAGYTLTQLIETSNICGHFVDAPGEAYIDIFSCKHFDWEAAMAAIHTYFEPAGANVSLRERGAPIFKKDFS